MGRMKWLFTDPQRDPQLAAALRRLEAEAGSPDLDRLHQRIVLAARHRRPGQRSASVRWWEWVDHWIPVAVPLGVAASLVAAVLLPVSEELTVASAYAAEAPADSALVTAAFSDQSSGGQIAAHLIAPQEGEWILEEAVNQ